MNLYFHRFSAYLATFTSFVFAPGLLWAAEPAKENVPGGALMLGAYILIWAIPLGFLWLSHKRLTGLEGELQELREMMAKASANVPVTAPEEDATE